MLLIIAKIYIFFQKYKFLDNYFYQEDKKKWGDEQVFTHLPLAVVL